MSTAAQKELARRAAYTAAHAAAAAARLDPYPVYLTEAEVAGGHGVLSVNGHTGVVDLSGTFAGTATPGTPATAVDTSATAQTKAGAFKLLGALDLGDVGVTQAAGTQSVYVRKASGKSDAWWYENIASGSLESGLYTDRVWNFGYNRAADGTKLAGEPMLFLQMETKFRNNSGTPYGSEYHLNFGRPTDAFTFNRPISVFMEHVSGATQLVFAGSVTVTGSGDATGRFVIPDGAGAVTLSGGQYLQVAMPASSLPPYVFSAITSGGANIWFVDNAGRSSFGGAAYTGSAKLCITTTTASDDGMLEFNYNSSNAGGTNKGWRLGPMVDFLGDFVLMTWYNTPFLRVDPTTGRLVQSLPPAAPTDAHIGNSQMSAWLDEAGALLKFRVRKSNGTYLTGSVAVA